MKYANSPNSFRPPHMPQLPLARLIGIGILVFVGVVLASSTTYVVQPGNRGVKVILGKVQPEYLKQGLGFKSPFVTRVVQVPIRQRTQPLKAECYSSDLQQVNAQLQILYRIPQQSVVSIFQNYAGDQFDSLIAPRVQEALKEVAALQTAEMIVTNRLLIKSKSLDLARAKIGTNFLDLVDLVIEEFSLSKELENAIEQKMVQEQEAAKAKFTQRKAEIEAETAIIQAKGEADSIRIRGEALDLNPSFIDLQILEKWDGKSPLVIGGDNSNPIMVPLNNLENATRR
ncbi:MAG: prohibitin family protein [Verrucomicrobiota bacterium]